MGRSVGEIITTVDTLVTREIRFVSIKEGIRLGSQADLQTKVMVTMFSLFADIERELISMRTKEGLAAARAKGKKLGRPKGSRRRRGHQQQAQALFASLALEPVTPAVADAYVQIKADLQRKGEMIPEADLWIAATARAGGYLLVTRDDHFSRVEGLQTADWSK